MLLAGPKKLNLTTKILFIHKYASPSCPPCAAAPRRAAIVKVSATFTFFPFVQHHFTQVKTTQSLTLPALRTATKAAQDNPYIFPYASHLSPCQPCAQAQRPHQSGLRSVKFKTTHTFPFLCSDASPNKQKKKKQLNLSPCQPCAQAQRPHPNGLQSAGQRGSHARQGRLQHRPSRRRKRGGKRSG